MKNVQFSQVHVVLAGRRRSYSSMGKALGSVRFRVVTERVLRLLDDEIVEMIKAVFFVK